MFVYIGYRGWYRWNLVEVVGLWWVGCHEGGEESREYLEEEVGLWWT